MINTVTQFSDAIRASGMEPPNVIEPGKLHRFPGIGKRQSNRAGWCMLFDDGLGGCYGDWASGFSDNWQANRNKVLSHAERSAFSRRVQESKKQVEAVRSSKYIDAANRASAIWRASSPAPDNHAYLLSKGIKNHNARISKSSLLLPVMDFSGKLTSLQFIGIDGRKLLLSGGRKQGCFIPITNDVTDSVPVIICEGWATGCTLSENQPASRVLAAIDAGNLQKVAVAARSKWLSAEIVIAGDDDRLTPGNPGITKARAAAIAAGALLALPQWPIGSPETLTDFNDLTQWVKGGLRG
jgi:putative DNA primase/helicase